MPSRRARVLLVLGAFAFAGCADEAPAPPTAAPPGPALACFDRPCGVVIGEGAYREPSATAHPDDPLRVFAVAATNASGRPVEGFLTTDGGVSWAPVALPAPEGRAAADDVSAAFLKDGTLLVVATVFLEQGPPGPLAGAATLRKGDVALWRSADGGATFGPPALLHDSRGLAFGLDAPEARSGMVGDVADKTLVVADLGAGDAYVLFSLVREGPEGRASDVLLARSRDAGRTWSTPVVALPGAYGASAAALDGTLLATALSAEFGLHRSVDGGATWTRVLALGPPPGPSLAWQPVPVALWRANGSLAAAAARASGGDGGLVEVLVSRDGGASWGPPRAVLEDAPTARRNLALAVDPRDGRGLLAAFQGDPGERDGFEVFAQPLLDGIPLDDRKLNEVAHDGDLHERMGAAASGGRAYVVWADAGLEAQPLLAANLTWGA